MRIFFSIEKKKNEKKNEKKKKNGKKKMKKKNKKKRKKKESGKIRIKGPPYENQGIFERGGGSFYSGYSGK